MAILLLVQATAGGFGGGLSICFAACHLHGGPGCGQVGAESHADEPAHLHAHEAVACGHCSSSDPLWLVVVSSDAHDANCACGDVKLASIDLIASEDEVELVPWSMSLTELTFVTTTFDGVSGPTWRGPPKRERSVDRAASQRLAIVKLTHLLI
jgi:hypothetical protein